MRTEEEINAKLKELQRDLSALEKKWFKSDSDKIWIEFYKNNIAFINWALGGKEEPVKNVLRARQIEIE